MFEIKEAAAKKSCSPGHARVKAMAFTLIELLVVIAQYCRNHVKVLCKKFRIVDFADAKSAIRRKFLERMDGVRGRKGGPFFKKGSLPSPTPFTLIELLVVIAIIAILAAMVLPALQQARARGRASQCINNLRELGQVFTFYSDDNRGWFPAYWDKNPAGEVVRYWYNGAASNGLLVPYLGASDFPIGLWGHKNTNTSQPIGRHRISCPELNGFFPLSSAKKVVYGYGYNIGICDNPSKRKVIRFVRPTSLGLIGDIVDSKPKWTAGTVYPTSNSNYIGSYIRHGKNAGVLFAAGNVSMLDRNKLGKVRYYPDK